MNELVMYENTYRSTVAQHTRECMKNYGSKTASCIALVG